MSKKDAVLETIQKYLDHNLSVAEIEGKLDHFKLEINNHKGTLQMDIQYRQREKAY